MGGAKSQKNKPHKTKFSTKSSRNVHKLASVSGAKRPGAGTGRFVANGQRAKDLRMQRNKNIRDHKRAVILAEKRASSGAAIAPRIMVLIPLSSKVRLKELENRLIGSLSSDDQVELIGDKDDDMDTKALVTREGWETTVTVPQVKLRLSVARAPIDDLQACLEVAKVADVIAFAIQASEDGEHVDKEGKLVLSMLRGLGFPTTIGLVMGLDEVHPKRRSDVKKSALAALQAQLPEESKCFSADNADDFQQIMRHIADQRPSGPQWRSERPYLVAQEVSFSTNTEDRATLLLSGYVRSRGLSVNQLVHVAGIGDFQFSKIEVLDDPFSLHQKRRVPGKFEKDPMASEEEQDDAASCLGYWSAGRAASAHEAVLPDPELQEMVVVENSLDPIAGEQTWPTEEELLKAGEERRNRRSKRLLPKGTSEYQASWIVDDSDLEDDQDDVADSVTTESKSPHSGEQVSNLFEDKAMVDEMEDDPSSRSDSGSDDEDDGENEMMDDEVLTPAQRAEEVQRLRAAHSSNEEFPDEIDTPIDQPARERFAKYRGLKSFRTSPWDPKETLPSEYARIFAFDNAVRTHKHVLSKATEIDRGVAPGCVSANTYVRVHIKNVPLASAQALTASVKQFPVIACGLLQHESKLSVLHFSIRKHDGYQEPIKSKEELIFHSGFRRYNARPIFSADDVNMNKHKFERFLPQGQFALASVYTHVAFPAMPLIVFRKDVDCVRLAASGSLRSVDPDQIILKRIVLSGFPQKVSKRKAVVRFLFHNPQDVRWFRPLELWTKYGRRGRIKEPVGTHGSMKCIFDGVVQQRDAVCISLYKRVYPKWPSE